MPKTPWLRRSSCLWLLFFVLGCSTSDDRLRELSEQSVARQADQNRQIAQQSTTMVEASRDLVDSEGQARREQLALQEKLVEAEDRSRQERRAIWKLYIDKFHLDATQPKPVDADWTGAEIRACCRLAALLDVSLVEAARNVVPVAKTGAEAVERLRSWANGRCLSADVPGLYQRLGDSSTKPGRRVRRDPSQN
jgi:hypothetical protein